MQNQTKNWTKDEFKMALLLAGGFRTGSRAFRCEAADSDEDVVVTVKQLSDAVGVGTVRVDGVVMELPDPLSYRGSIKVGLGPVLNVIVVADDNEYKAWKFATESLMFSTLDLNLGDRKRRVEVFRLLLIAYRILNL